MGKDSIYKPSLIKAGLASIYKNLQRILRFLTLSIKKLSVKGWDGSHQAGKNKSRSLYLTTIHHKFHFSFGEEMTETYSLLVTAIQSQKKKKSLLVILLDQTLKFQAPLEFFTLAFTPLRWSTKECSQGPTLFSSSSQPGHSGCDLSLGPWHKAACRLLEQSQNVR